MRKWKIFYIEIRSETIVKIALSVVSFILIALPIWYIIVQGCAKIQEEFTCNEAPFSVRNIILLLIALMTALFTWWRNIISEKTTKIQNQAVETQSKAVETQNKAVETQLRANEMQEIKRQDELFAKAVDLLGNERKLIQRKAGVYILKDLALTSAEQIQKCMDILCALNETWMPKMLVEYPDFFEINEYFPEIKNPAKLKLFKSDANVPDSFLTQNDLTKNLVADVVLSQEALIAIADIIFNISKNDLYNEKYDLRNKYLCGISLCGVKFKKFLLRGVKFHGAFLEETNFENALLNDAEFNGAKMERAVLNGAELGKAKFRSAVMHGAKLNGASLCKTDLEGARLMNAEFNGTNVSGADFRGTGVKREQLVGALNADIAIFDEATEAGNLKPPEMI